MDAAKAKLATLEAAVRAVRDGGTDELKDKLYALVPEVGS